MASCSPRDTDTAPEGVVDHTGDPECRTDDDCDAGATICEADACVDGDRDNDEPSATALLWDDPTDGVINPVGDVDWYSVQADGGEFVRIAVTTAEAEDGIDSVVSVYNAAGKRVAWEDEHPAGEVSGVDSVCYAYFADAGTYYIEVEDKGTFDTSVGAVGGPDQIYTLQITEAGSDVSEPDSAMAVGADYGTLASSSWYSFPVLLGAAGDTDWATLDLPAPGAPIYVIALQHGEESDMTPAITIRNHDGTDVVAMTNPSADAPALLPDAEGTSYVIGVTDADGGGGPTYWTWVFFLVRDAGTGNEPETEPNDDLASASPLSFEDQQPDSGKWWAGYAQGRIGSPTDADVYAFDVPFDGAYITTYLGAQQYGGFLVARLELLDATGATLDTVDSVVGADTDAPNLGPYPAGSYFLRVTATPDSGAVGGEGFFYLFGLHATSSAVSG